MIIFKRHNSDAAIAHIGRGEQVLVVGQPTAEERKLAGPPFCHSRRWGQLIDQNLQRLEQTARRLLNGPIRIMGRGTIHQSVLLCGDPLRRLMRNANP